MNKNYKAFLVTKEAKHTKCIDCEIEGMENQGFGTTVIRSRIYNFREKYPNIWKGSLITFFLSIITGIVLMIIKYVYFIKN